MLRKKKRHFKVENYKFLYLIRSPLRRAALRHDATEVNSSRRRLYGEKIEMHK